MTTCVSQLQEFTQQRYIQNPRYTDHTPTGPPHQPIFTTTCEVVVDGFVHRSKGTGNNKKDSKQQAAAGVLKSLIRATPSAAPSRVVSGNATTEFSPILDNLSSRFGNVGITQNQRSPGAVFAEKLYGVPPKSNYLKMDSVKINTETENVTDALRAENQKLQKKIDRLQRKLDKVSLALTENASDEEDDE